MPTNDERREIAARLREVKTFAIRSPLDELDALTIAVGCNILQEHWRVHLADRLADLIEPEPERTCRYKRVKGALYVSECGIRRYFVDVPLPLYCPNCGAKVVDK